jgi:hypothetical protein
LYLVASGRTVRWCGVVAQTVTVHHGALGYLLGINALRASEAASVRIEDYADTLRGYRVLHLMGKGNKPATMPLTVPVLRVLKVCRGERARGPLILRPISGRPVDRRDVYRMVARIAKMAAIPGHVSPHSLRHAAITNALDAGVPMRDAQILARHADPRTTLGAGSSVPARLVRSGPLQFLPHPCRGCLQHRARRRPTSLIQHPRPVRAEQVALGEPDPWTRPDRQARAQRPPL